MTGSVMTNPGFGYGSDPPLSINYSMSRLFLRETFITVEQKVVLAIICNKPIFSDIIRRIRLTESAKMHALLMAMNDKTCLSIKRLRKNVMFSINKHECRIRWCSGTRQPTAVAMGI